MATDDKKPAQVYDSAASLRQPEDVSGGLNSEAKPEVLQSAQIAGDEQASAQSEHVEQVSLQQDSVQQDSVQQETGGYEHTNDPTRYGDWEIAGRCVDF